MQELVSFISIMLGTIVLTAWVMWILLRPSGDSKVEEFATRSARDGLTEVVIENNVLKNKVTRLERELKVLMSAGYPGKSEEQGEGLKTKDEGLGTEEEGLKAKDEEAQSRSAARRDGLKGGAKDEGRRTRDEGLGTKNEEKGKGKDEALKAKDEEVQSRSAARRDALKGEAKGEGLRTRDEGEKAEEESRKAQENLLKIKELESQIQENEARVKAKAVADATAAKPAAATPSPEVVPLSEAPRVTDEAEKKKISDYLVSVAETTERQMKEVKALDETESRYSDDDLKKIKGIGPHLERRLKKAGISSYQQISCFNEAEIQHVSKVIGSYPRRIRREAWVEQAKVLVNKG